MHVLHGDYAHGRRVRKLDHDELTTVAALAIARTITVVAVPRERSVIKMVMPELRLRWH